MQQVSGCRIYRGALGGLYGDCHTAGVEGLRIPYLTRARNKVLERFLELQAGSKENGSFGWFFLNNATFTVCPPPIHQISCL